MPTRTRQSAKTVNIPAVVRGLLEEIGQLAQARQLAAYAVGGCVRDWMLGRTRTVDVDVMIEGDGVAFAQALAARWQVPITVHPQFKTATIRPVLRKRVMRLDVATCRKETYAEPVAYPRVTPGTLRDDLLRRDFTINAMAISLEPAHVGRLVDPFGGSRDLRAKRLRILHLKSFQDDPSRILRAARFVPRFGLRVESSTARAMTRAIRAGLVARLNRGRIQKEMARMLEEPHPLACAKLLERWMHQQPRA